MSQPAPAKGSFLNTLLLMMVIFMGFQLFTQQNNKPADTRTIPQILAEMRKLNAQVKDVTIQNELAKYEHKVNEVASKEKWDESKKQAALAEGYVLAAHTALVGGIQRNESSRVNTGFAKLDANYGWLSTSPAWKQTFAVTGQPKAPETQYSPESLYEKSVETLSVLHRDERVMGIFPGWHIIDSLVAATGRVPGFSYWFAGFLLAVVVRAAIFPLAQKQLMASREMMQLVPLMNDLKKKHTPKNGTLDQMAYQQDMMALYKEYGVNPYRGCGPALVQLPLFLLVFQFMMNYRFEFQKGTFLWINPASSAASNHFFAPNLGKMDTLLLVIYGITMLVSTYLTPVSDPTQAKQQRIMGMAVALFATVTMFFFPLPSAFVVYWIFLNLFSTAQSLYTYRLPIPPLQKVQTAAGGVRARSSFFDKLLEQQEIAVKMQAEQKKAAGNSDEPANPDASANGKLYKPERPSKKAK